MGRKRKVTFRGNTYYVGAKLAPSKCPKRCVRGNKTCAFRIKMTGMSGIRESQTACGYMYYTGEARNCNDPNVCTRWAENLPTEILMTFWGEEEKKTDGEIYDE